MSLSERFARLSKIQPEKNMGIKQPHEVEKNSNSSALPARVAFRSRHQKSSPLSHPLSQRVQYPSRGWDSGVAARKARSGVWKHVEELQSSSSKTNEIVGERKSVMDRLQPTRSNMQNRLSNMKPIHERLTFINNKAPLNNKNLKKKQRKPKTVGAKLDQESNTNMEISQ